MSDKYNIDALLSNVVDSKPLEFTQNFNDILVDKLKASIEDKKIEVAQSMFQDKETDDEVEEVAQEEEEE